MQAIFKSKKIWGRGRGGGGEGEVQCEQCLLLVAVTILERGEVVLVLI